MAEGGGLLNRYTVNIRIVGSNPIPSATALERSLVFQEITVSLHHPTHKFTPKKSINSGDRRQVPVDGDGSEGVAFWAMHTAFIRIPAKAT